MLKKIKFIFLLILILGAVFLVYYNYQIDTAGYDNPEKKEFSIDPGSSIKEISKNLKSAGLIKSEFWFKFYLKRSGLASKILANSFELSPQMSIKEIAKILSSPGVNSREKNITIIEGWNNEQIGAYLEKETNCTQEEWFDLTKNYKNSQFGFLKNIPAGFDLEGFLFPDTYRIFVDSGCEGILIKMLTNFDRKLTTAMRSDIQKQDKNIWEIIIMASLVEKEVRSVDDMQIVSGIFWDRIKNKQALESCASLAYILKENKDQYSYEDTRIQSPYNTYLNRGLPPGPIANPGINAIRAAIYPENTNYNYFLTDPQTGNTIWSKTFEEHKQNKWKYLQ